MDIERMMTKNNNVLHSTHKFIKKNEYEEYDNVRANGHADDILEQKDNVLRGRQNVDWI